MSEDKKFKELRDTPIDRFVMVLGALGDKSSDEIFSPGNNPDDIWILAVLGIGFMIAIQEFGEGE